LDRERRNAKLGAESRQSQEEVKRYAANVMKSLRDALHYDELEKIFDLLK
jgi:hypothetical protein